MKIKKISCTQFAGVNDRDVAFTDGVNVIYGKNESGKSTLVNLLSRILFQDVNLDRRKDKDFFSLYFPSARKGSAITGDFVDGKITFETENGTYTLSKEWGAESRCSLSTPDGVIRDQSKINEILKEVLAYGEGVYSDMLLSSQRNTDTSLQTILDASNRTEAKQEIVNVVSQAFAESDGISADEIEAAIKTRFDEIAGKHWDFEKEAPVRKNGRWSTGVGEILKAYYAFEDAREVLDKISELEAEFDRAASEYNEKEKEVAFAEDSYNKFNTFARQLAVQSERKKSIKRITEELLKNSEILVNWPKLTEATEKAKVLEKEKSNREILDKYGKAKAISDEIKETEKNFENALCPTGMEIEKVKTAQRGMVTLENKLCGMNLSAAVSMMGNNSVEITSLRTGAVIDVSNGLASISEAVKITIPGVMEMRLSPANVDVASIEAQLDEQKKIAFDILSKYRVKSLEELENLEKRIANAKEKAENAKERLKTVLGDVAFEELKEKTEEITDNVRSQEEIENDIVEICESKHVEKFITAKETIISGYVSEYHDINELKQKVSSLEEELEKAKASTVDDADIPEEYLNISDPEEYLQSLQNTLKLKQNLCETALTDKTAAASKLESYKENVSDSPAEDAEKAERIFLEKKALLNHWINIAKTFDSLKEEINDNPMNDIAESFTHYLGTISGGKISSEFPDADKLNMDIYSDNKLLDYGKLSEGTKETVSLAFRLAVLDHLFPEGGGVIVLDDPFTDMDAERVAQSCELVKECANRHQVIFLTCREEYMDLLNGNNIRF